MRVSKILALSLVASLSTASSVIAHETAVPHSESIHDGPYRVNPLIAPEECLMPGKVGGPVYVKDRQSVPKYLREWYVFHVSKLEQIYNPETQSCLDVDNKGTVITVKCKKDSLDSAIWYIRELGDTVQIAIGDQCINYTGGKTVGLLNCYANALTHLWKIIDNNQPLPKAKMGGDAAKLNMAPKTPKIPLKCDCDCTVR